jgi:gliding motility-associated-like protein
MEVLHHQMGLVSNPISFMRIQKLNLAILLVLIHALAIGQRDGNTVYRPVSVTNYTADCNNWLRTPAYGDYISIGDLDVIGNQLTVELNYNSLAFSSNGSWGHLVSKHTNTLNVNYAISPNGAELTTTNSGYVVALQTCPIQFNKTYHTAMVYDGTTLKFYRNGFLVSQTPCSGNIVNNNLATHIGQIAGGIAPGEQFHGYINEVRIWNVARTQAQLQTYMNSSLPSPTTQPGLLGYYTFDNLLNKQGNAAFNGSLNGSATINATNTSCNFVADSCAVIPCSNWLSTPSSGSYVTVGDLDVTGNQITVEANFNRTQALNSGLYYGHLISKHTGGSNINYALLPNGCEITTSSGYHSTFQNCLPQLNKTYHVAMVYDGAALKFYRNGFLISQVACTGSIVTNDLLTTIAQVSSSGAPSNNHFLGYVNEVRIWNVARTQAQLQTFMNSSLPNPTTQPGLLGYYTFDNLLNKQGNAAFNATLNGGATINATNSSCSFTADSCRVTTSIGNIINAYTPVLGLEPCGNKITVENATAYNVGDTVLLMQMKGAVIDSTITAAFGTVTDYKSAGNYEFNYVKSKVGNVIELKNKLIRTYEIPNGKVQLIRVPYYDNARITSTLTCLPWDGSKGGVLVFNVADTVELNANINVKGKGFRGGGNPNLFNTTLACFENNYTVPSGTTRAAAKGESIYITGNANSCAKGPNASGGGGGNGHNSGGGGGANGGPGGLGGYQLLDCGNAPFDNRGLGGKPLTYTNAANKVFLGGGGGGGHTDNTGGIDMKGGNGGGIVIINANHFKGNNFTVVANGDSGQICNNALNNCHDGNGGGGAGGSLLLNINNFINAAPLQAIGGKGADLVLYNPGASANKIGPGGGGGGGMVWLKAAALPANITTNLTGGANGSILQNANDPWGATAGQAGTIAYNLLVPFDTVPFKPNIDSVRIKDSLLTCKTIDFKGLGFTNTVAIAQWQWFFGDGGTANTQNAVHTYTNAGTYTVKLVVTDINGCKDSTTKPVTVANCANVICKSSFGFRIPDNAIVDIVPSGTGAFSQLYNTNGFTWETWYRPNGNIVDKSLILSTEDAVLFQDIFLGFGWGSTNNALSFLVSDNGNTNATVAAQSLQTINPNTWYHVAGVCDYAAAQLRLYLNGVLVATAPIPASILNNRLSGNRITQIGNASARANGVDGSIDEVRFWGTVRTQAQIQNSMNTCLNLPQSGLVAYFKADENGGLNSKSEVDLNFSAILRNATWSNQVANVNCSSLSMADSIADCNHLFVKGLLSGGIVPAQIAQWQWTFGDGGIANTPNAEHIYSIGGIYTVKLVVTDINGCKDSVSKNVTVNLLTPDAGRDTTVCSNGSVSINLLATGGTGYNWSPVGVVSNPNIANPVATVNTTTRLYVTVTNAAGCSGTDSVTITVNALPNVIANNDTAICILQPLPLLATGAATYVWSPAAAVSNPTIANPAFTGSQTQQLIVTGTSALGCKTNDTVQITVNQLPLVNTIADTIICGTQALVLTTTGAQTYQWAPPVFLSNPNAASPSFTGNTSQTYQVAGTDANGCVGKDTVAITVPTIAGLQAPVNRTVCSQDTVILNGNNGPAFQYAWSPATGLSNPLIEKPIFNATVTTPYVLTITEPFCNLQRTFNVLVTVNPLPLVSATSSNDIDCATPFSQLRASGATQYNWQPNNISLSNPVVTPTATTLYIVKGTDANGCSAYDSVEVKVFANGKDFTEMPNSFTPNGDGLNDCYGPGRFWRNIVTMELIIYNRWGERVFYSTNPTNCWDGTYKGVNAEANAYVYHLKVKTTCGDVVKKGHVILIR